MSNPGMVTFIFDDACESIYRNAWPLFRKMNMPACIAVPSAYYFSPGPKDLLKRFVPGQRKISLKNLHLLENAGWEIMSHSHTHPKLMEIPVSAIERELKLSKELLCLAEFKVRQFVAPYSVFPEQYLYLIRDFYSAHYGNYGQRDENDPASLTNTIRSNPYCLQRINFHNVPIDRICQWLDYTAEKSCWLVLYEHQIGYKNFSSTEKLEKILQEIKKHGLQVRTGSEALALLRS
jgi:peptidoglycan/xylan/chitin deacetylase (PgdA/CDA1 family)